MLTAPFFKWWFIIWILGAPVGFFAANAKGFIKSRTDSTITFAYPPIFRILGFIAVPAVVAWFDFGYRDFHWLPSIFEIVFSSVLMASLLFWLVSQPTIVVDRIDRTYEVRKRFLMTSIKRGSLDGVTLTTFGQINGIVFLNLPGSILNDLLKTNKIMIGSFHRNSEAKAFASDTAEFLGITIDDSSSINSMFSR